MNLADIEVSFYTDLKLYYLNYYVPGHRTRWFILLVRRTVENDLESEVKYSTNPISEKLERFPSANLSIAPTPIYRLPRLSRQLDCNIYIMREDLTGFALGGNKTRKLDFLIGDAIAHKADTLITTAASSFSRNAAAAGKAFGLEVHVVLAGTESKQNSASQALFKQLDTILHYVPQADEASIKREYDRIVLELENQGKVIYQLHPGGSDAIGCLGYIDAFNQIVRYSLDAGIHFSKIIHSTGSAATQSGLVLGQSISGYDTVIIGMAASQKKDIQCRRVYELALSTSKMLNIALDESKIVVDDRFIGPGYALPSKEADIAAKMFACTEGVLLDDVYTAKAGAGLIHYAVNAMFGKVENILFIHTGGNAGLFY